MTLDLSASYQLRSYLNLVNLQNILGGISGAMRPKRSVAITSSAQE